MSERILADSDDESRLLSEEMDMVSTDLRGMRVGGLKLQSRDFRKAKLDHAVFENCDLSGSNFEGASLNQVSFVDCNLERTSIDGSIFRVNFGASKLGGARIKGLMHQCDFKLCDLRGTDLSKSRIDDLGTNFDDVLYDVSTDFEGLQALRAYTRLPIFQHYDYSRGTFTRKLQDPPSEPAPQSSRPTKPQEEDEGFSLYGSATIHDLIAHAEEAAHLLEQMPAKPVHGGPGHNNPPPDAPFDQEEKSTLAEALRTISGFAKGAADVTLEAGRSALATIRSGAKKIAGYLAEKLDVAVDSFMKKLGESAASKTFLFGTCLLVAGKLDMVLSLAEKFLSTLV